MFYFPPPKATIFYSGNDDVLLVSLANMRWVDEINKLFNQCIENLRFRCCQLLSFNSTCLAQYSCRRVLRYCCFSSMYVSIVFTGWVRTLSYWNISSSSENIKTVIILVSLQNVRIFVYITFELTIAWNPRCTFIVFVLANVLLYIVVCIYYITQTLLTTLTIASKCC